MSDDGNGIIKTTGTNTTVAEAASRLEDAINENDKLRLMAKVDHTAGAASVGLVLPDTVEFIFGNPTLGTPLMQAAPTAAIDLPQKMVVMSDGGDGVVVLHNDPQYLAQRHGIPSSTPELATAATALQNLADIAAG